MNNKAQIKIFENIGVLLMFLILVVIALVFYFVFSRGELEESRAEFSTQNAVEVTSKIALLPELQCRKNNAQEDHCFDKTKIQVLGTTLTEPTKQEDYFDLFGFSTITITSVYPNSYKTVIYSNEKSDFTNKDTFVMPTSIYDPIYEEYNYGILEVSVFS
jgi:preprotein translocase subunit YajC